MSTEQPTAHPIAEWKVKYGPAVVSVVRYLAVLALGALAAWLGLPKSVVEVVKEIPAQLPLAAEPGPIDYEGARYDGDHHEHVGEAEAARWPTDRITYSVDYASARGLNPPLSDDAIRAAFRQAAGWWSEQLAIELVEVEANGHIPIRFERMDGPGGVLAEAYLADGTGRPKPMRFDAAERWTAGPPAANLVSLPTVACHELGHSLGLGHDAGNAPAVMRPTYTSAIPREQERDIARMVGLGYRRRERVPPGPADVLAVPVQVKMSDVIEALQKAGYKVGK